METRVNRRLACVRLCLTVLLLVAGRPTHAQTPAQSPPDLLIRNGRVIDPRNNIDAVMDVAVSGGKITRVAAGIAPTPAMRVIDATGLYVVPGLIDIHAHVFFGTEKDAYLSNADRRCSPTATPSAAARRRSWMPAARVAELPAVQGDR